jgi:adenylate cyclase
MENALELVGPAPARIRRDCLAACAMTDAEGYTGLAEGMDPPRLVEFVNAYFEALFGAVLANGGVVLDVKGDGILAVWTSERPDADLRAQVCAACLQMLDAAELFNESFPTNRLPTRIGVDFGPIALADVGAFARYEYRAIGDTVNTCSRLEQLNKSLGTRLLVSSHLAEGVDRFLFRDLGDFTLRGKRSPLRVLELVTERGRATWVQRLLCQEFAAALAAYEAARIEDALARFRALRARFPQDGPSYFFLRRCLAWKQNLAVGRATLPAHHALAHAPL